MRAAPAIRSLTFRLTLAYLAVMAATFGALIGAYWLLGAALPLDRVKADVDREAAQLAAAHRDGGLPALERALEARAAAPAMRRPYHALIAPDGRTLTANLPSWPSAPAASWLRMEADLYADGLEADHEALALDLALPDGARLLVGRDIEDIDDRQEIVLDAVLWCGGALIVLGLPGGVLVSSLVARRLAGIRRAAITVMAGDLSGRVPTRGGTDDFDQLATVLNAMLARIEALVEAVSHVSDAIAHELRTPLARLYADLEDLDEAPAGERDPLIRQAMDNAARMQSVFDALLRIARLETGRHVLRPADLSLDRLLADVAELYEPGMAAKAQRLDLSVDADRTIRADPDLLFQALANLLDNAVKFAPRGATIAVSAQTGPDGAHIEIRDDGGGVDPAHLPRLTERFYRPPGGPGASEESGDDGAGLGLSLVQAVARAHHGRLTLSSGPPGFCARLDLPDGGASRAASSE